MARKPKAAQTATAVGDEAAAADTPAVARRGRRSSPPVSLPIAQDAAEPVAAASPRRPGPKPKPQEMAPTPVPPVDAAGKQSRKPRLAKPGAEPSITAGPEGGEPAPTAVAPDQPSAEKPAAQWDQPTGTVRFDWSAIESTAAQPGPNQIMAKLLIAARAEGANSRWPLQ